MLCVSKYGEGRNICVTRSRYSANHNALDSRPIRAHSATQNDELCKSNTLQKDGAERNENNVVFFTIRKHIALLPNTQNNVIFSNII